MRLAGPVRKEPIRFGRLPSVHRAGRKLDQGDRRVQRHVLDCVQAVLLDGSKPVDPRAASPGISMISDLEMKRINLEFSANLARLARMLHEDERACRHLLHLACEYLALPRLRPARCDELLDPLLGLTSLRMFRFSILPTARRKPSTRYGEASSTGRRTAGRPMSLSRSSRKSSVAAGVNRLMRRSLCRQSTARCRPVQY